MNIKDIKQRVTSACDYANAGRMESAFDRLEETAILLRVSAAMRDRLRRARENYRYMSDFAMTGGTDVSRRQRYADIRHEALSIGDLMLREAMAEETPTLYYSTLRFERTRPADTISALLEQYSSLPKDDSQGRESLEKRIFNSIWTTHPLSDADVEVLGNLLSSDDSQAETYFSRLVQSALMLGEIEWHDAKRIDLLLSVYRLKSNECAGIEALTAVVLAAFANDKFNLDLTADESMRKDLEMVVRQIVRAFDTERVKQKMSDEIIPELMKLKPEIDRRISELTRDAEGLSSDMSMLGMNPEWEELMNQSKVGDKLREMNDLQMDGADVMFTAFSALKWFPFFNDPSNWFLPFHASHSVARKAGDKAVDKLSQLVQSMPMLCDSDKYSLLLLTGQMGGTGFNNLTGELQEQANALREEQLGDLDAANKEKIGVVRRYVQNVYRFFRLFRRKGEFRDPFLRAGLPEEVVPLSGLFRDNPELTSTISDFLFRNGHYKEALPLLIKRNSVGMCTAEGYQRIGYAMQRCGDMTGALEMYLNADLLQSDSVWTLRRIGAIYRANGESDKAVPFLKRAAELSPDNVDLAMALGGALLESGKPKEALNLYFKADYLRSGEKTSRLIAWCLLMDGQYERSLEAYRKLGSLPGGYTPSDLLNLGHLDIIFNRYGDAAQHYASAIADYNFDTARFESELANDRKILEKHGIDPLTIDLIADRALRISSGFGTVI